MSFDRPCSWKLCTLYCFSGVNGVFFSKFKIITSTTDCVKNNNTGVLTFLILIHQMTQLIWYTCIYIHDGFIFLNKKLICRGVFHHLHLGTKHLSKSYQTLKKIMHLWSIVMLISNTRTVRNYKCIYMWKYTSLTNFTLSSTRNWCIFFKNINLNDGNLEILER